MKLRLSLIRHAVFPALLLSVTFFIFGAFEMYFTNQEEFWFSLGDIFFPCMLIAGISTMILTCVSSLVGRYSTQAARIINSIIFGLGVALYIQGNYMVMDYGVLDGKAIEWGEYTTYGILSTLVWVLCVVISIILNVKKSEVFEKVIKWGSMFILAIQVSTLAVLVLTSKFEVSDNAEFTTKNEFLLSKNKNVIVFVVDSLDTQYTNAMLSEFPEIETIFKDFTYYNDVLGMGPTTRGSLPLILTGETYLNEQPFKDFLQDAYQNGYVAQAAKKSGYEMDVYTSKQFAVPLSKESITNLETAENKLVELPAFLQSYYKLIGFRYMPHYIKEHFLISYNEFEQYKSLEGELEVYSSQNLTFYNGFCEKGLQADRESSVIKVYHLTGTHPPFNMDENINKVTTEETSGSKQARGCFRIIEEYIEQMKKLGVYDSSAIMIMADHGTTGFNQCPSLLIKQPDVFNQSLQIDTTPISYVADLPKIWNWLLRNEDAELNSLLSYTEDVSKARLYYYYTWDNLWDSEYMPDLYQYACTGVARDMDGTDFTGNIYSRTRQGESYVYEIGSKCTINDEQFFSTAVKSGMSRFYAIENGKTNYYAWFREKALIEVELSEKTESDLILRFDVYLASSSEQSVEALINGKSIGTKNVLLGDDVLEFIIPKEFISGDNIEIELYSQNAVPYKNDPVPVSVAIGSMQITDANKDTLSEVVYPKMNEKINFSFVEGCNYDDVLRIRGMYPAASNAAWSRDKVQLSFCSDCQEDIVFTMKYGTFNNEIDAAVFYNGHEIGQLNQTHATVEFILPKEYMNQTGVQVVEIRIFNAVSPKIYGAGEDTRVLGICVNNISVAYDRVPSIDFDTKVLFRKNDSSLNMVKMSGVYAASEKAAWSSGHMEILFNTVTEEDITFEIKYGTYYENLDAVVMFNGTEVGCLTKAHSTEKIKLPKELIRDEEPQKVEIVVHGATSPANLGIGKDTRELGICLDYISFYFQ